MITKYTDKLINNLYQCWQAPYKTAVPKDHKLSAQWEHTLLVTETGCEVLTKRQEENF